MDKSEFIISLDLFINLQISNLMSTVFVFGYSLITAMNLYHGKSFNYDYCIIHFIRNESIHVETLDMFLSIFNHFPSIQCISFFMFQVTTFQDSLHFAFHVSTSQSFICSVHIPWIHSPNMIDDLYEWK